MHDLSIFVGRNHYDKAETDEELKDLVYNPAKISYGQLP